MIAKLTMHKHIELELSEEEALWLKRLVQSPVKYRDPRDEPSEEVDMRSKYWNALSSVI